MDRQKLKELDIRQFNMIALELMRDDAIMDIHLAIRRWGLSKRAAQSLATTGMRDLIKVAAGTSDPLLRFAGTQAFELLMAQVKSGEPEETILISQLSHLASMPLKSEP